MGQKTFSIAVETTPNPDTLKFKVNQTLIESGSAEIDSVEKASPSPIAKALFDLGVVVRVYLGRDFVSVTKTPDEAWPNIAQKCVDALQKTLETAEDPIGDVDLKAESHHNDPISLKIKEILDREIRPAVAQDGGDIVFHGFENGVVTLHLQGACSSCPSSVLTLKMGVENRLKSLIPEVKEVVQL